MQNKTTMEGTVMGNAAEMAARFERATRSGLADSPLASYSYAQASSTTDRPPTLVDLLPHLGPPDAPRCPACRACLPFGSRSRICLACAAPLVQSSPPSFSSSLAFRHFSEVLHIDGLETDFGEAEGEFCSDPEQDVATKSSSSSLSLPLEVGRQKGLSHTDIPLHQGKPNTVLETVKSGVQTPLPNPGDVGSMTLIKPMDCTNVDEEKHASILDYSAKLEGISLEDFFSNQVKAQAPASATKSDMLLDEFSASMDNSGITVRKDSLFWDPLSESIIPNGFDLMVDTSETNTNTAVDLDHLVGIDEDDDPFSSWEGDFQSAAPAMADASAASSSLPHGPQLSADPITSSNIEDVFGDFSSTSVGQNAVKHTLLSHTHGPQLSADPNTSRNIDDVFGDFSSVNGAGESAVEDASSSHMHGPHLSADLISSRNIDDVFGDFSSTSGGGESVGIQGNNWVNDGDFFGSSTDVDNTFKTDSQRSADVDDFFRSGWQQSMPHLAVSSSSQSQALSSITQSTVLKSSQEDNLFGIPPSKQIEAPTVNHSFGSVGEITSTENSLMEQPASASDLVGKKKKIVSSLLAQLHDLSFLLADKLVVKSEGKNTKPDSSS